MAGGRTLKVTIVGDSKGAQKAFGELEGSATGFGAKMASAFGGLGKVALVAGAGIAVAGVAIGGVVAKSVKDFIGFENQMNEVFTLLPGISGDAMADMTGQVKDFSKEFGTLPNEVVPALYQALSAGVPQDNVFDFLETANKAAVGGVSDLETAVDGISSAVNAYGADVLSAAQASDLMFTTVRLGKTDFGQLSASLFNVLPVAASLGVGMEDVSAALASLTAQGTPTSVATTQIRAALQEASKAGGDLDVAIRELSGKSFPELIAEGGDIGTIFNDLRASMPDEDFRKLFGSVEALGAVLGITGEQGESFQKNLDQMKNSAGATDAAFAQMDTGLGRTIDKIRANFAVMALDIGAKVAPVVERFSNFMLSRMPQIGAALDRVGGFVGALAGKLQGPLTAAFEYVRFAISNIIDGFQHLQDEGAVNIFETLGQKVRDFVAIIRDQVIPTLQRFGVWFTGTAIPAIQQFAATVQTFITGQVVPAFQAFVSAVLPHLQTLIGFLQGNFKAVLIGVGAVVVAMFTAWTVSATAAAVATIAATLPIIAILGAIGLAAGTLYLAWTSNFLGIQDIVAKVWSVVQPILQAIGDRLRVFIDQILPELMLAWESAKVRISESVQNIWGIIQTVFGAIQSFLQTHGTQVQAIISAAWNMIQSTIQTVLAVISNSIQLFLNVIQGDWQGAWQNIQAIAAALWDQIKSTIQNALTIIQNLMSIAIAEIKELWSAGWQALPGAVSAVQGAIMGAVQGIISAVQGAFSGAAQWLYQAGADIVRGLVNGLDSMLGQVRNKAAEIANAAKDAVTSALGIDSPSKVFRWIGWNMMYGWIKGIEDYEPHLKKKLIDLSGSVGRWTEQSLAGAVTPGSIAQRIGMGYAPKKVDLTPGVNVTDIAMRYAPSIAKIGGAIAKSIADKYGREAIARLNQNTEALAENTTAMLKVGDVVEGRGNYYSHGIYTTGGGGGGGGVLSHMPTPSKEVRVYGSINVTQQTPMSLSDLLGGLLPK